MTKNKSIHLDTNEIPAVIQSRVFFYHNQIRISFFEYFEYDARKARFLIVGRM